MKRLNIRTTEFFMQRCTRQGVLCKGNSLSSSRVYALLRTRIHDYQPPVVVQRRQTLRQQTSQKQSSGTCTSKKRPKLGDSGHPGLH